MENKVCVVCNKEKQISEFYFRKDRGIYRPNCKKCKPLKRMADIMAKVANQTDKICKHCGIEKPVREYQKAGGGKWLQPYCKLCDAERKRKHREENIDRCIQRQKEYYENNKEIVLQKCKEYVENNKEVIQKKKKVYREKNRDSINAKGREYVKNNSEILKKKHRERYYANRDSYIKKGKQYRDNRTDEQKERKKKYDKEYKEKNKEKLLAWRLKNADKIREHKRIWSNNKAATDICYRIKRNIRTRIRCALKPNNAYKVDTSENLLGCSIDFFKNYMESLFTEGMNWDKFLSADIEIDHIKPCAKFDLTKESEQRKCFHYTNCQPMWWFDNNKKGATYIEKQAS